MPYCSNIEKFRMKYLIILISAFKILIFKLFAKSQQVSEVCKSGIISA